MQYLIYMAKNNITGKVYIGQTKKGLYKRKKEHQYNAVKNKKRHIFYDALRSYGFENFTWTVLLKCEQDDADYYEISLIESYNSTNRNFGYNLDGGGNKGKIRQCGLKGKDNPMYGKPMSELARIKLYAWSQSEERKVATSKQSKRQWSDIKFREKIKKIKTKIIKIQNISTGQIETGGWNELIEKFHLSSSGIRYYKKSKGWILLDP